MHVYTTTKRKPLGTNRGGFGCPEGGKSVLSLAFHGLDSVLFRMGGAASYAGFQRNASLSEVHVD